MNEKVFKDPIHGYISIPSSYCEYILDTPLMQRLRNIIQTSMRVLYPSAHHDRFSHTLGTYHLGSIAFHHLLKNIEEKYPRLCKDIIKNHIKYRHSFLIACLLHDCAHSPFSHTLEHFYKFNDLPNDLKNEMSKRDINFSEDYKFCKPKQHELMSALMVVKIFSSVFENIFKNECDINLIVRCIIGCPHRIKENFTFEFENAIISLLNSNAIDVDKLDYIMRDTLTSGFNNMSIDIHRLLSALTLIKLESESFVLGFKKNALSVIQNVITARNYLYEWIYCHHKVVYEKDLLIKSIEAVENREENKGLITCFFSKDMFEIGKEFNNYYFFMPTDGDLLYMLKKYYNEIPEIKELFSRKHKKSLWKSFAEYDMDFKLKTDATRRNIKDQAFEILIDKFKLLEEDFVILDAKADVKEINKNEVFIEIDKGCFSFENIFEQNRVKSFDFFYVYLNKEFYDKKNEIIKYFNKVN